MAQIILLLPGPDVLQLANCHKYVTRTTGKRYSEIYTFTTAVGQCAAGVDKILVIGHGSKTGFDGKDPAGGYLSNNGYKPIAPAEVARGIFDSGLPLDPQHKIAFDTCYAGLDQTPLGNDSPMRLVLAELQRLVARANPQATGLLGLVMSIVAAVTCSPIVPPTANPRMTGATGPSVTIGPLSAKRLVVPDSNLGTAGLLQDKLTQKHRVDLSAVPDGWDETLDSATLKRMAQREYNKLITFANDFRRWLTDPTHTLVDTNPTRKVSL